MYKATTFKGNKPESEIQREIVTYLTSRDYIVMRMNAGSIRKNVTMCPPGTPDLLVVRPVGAVVWLEVKAEGKQLRDTQKAMIAHLEAIGHTVYIVHSIEEVLESGL